MGAAYDLFGNGRTAIKMSLGRYTAKLGTEIAEGQGANPLISTVATTSRSWGDTNRNYVPDCDLGNFAENGECGGVSNTNFGKNNPNAVTYDPAVLNGYGKRDYNWDFTTEIQHQLRPGVGLTGGYYRNTGGYFRYAFGSPFSSKQRITDNLAVTPADYDTFCITAPTDSRLPDGGGYQVCGLADIKPDKYRAGSELRDRVEEVRHVQELATTSSTSPSTPGCRTISGSAAAPTPGARSQDRCFVVDSPQELLNCRVVTPFKAQTQVKLHGVFPFKAGVVASFAWQNLSGPAYDGACGPLGTSGACITMPTADIARTLGRPLSGGVASKDIPLVAPQTLFEDRISRLDLRLSKSFSFNRFRHPGQSRRLQRAERQLGPGGHQHLRRTVELAVANPRRPPHPGRRAGELLAGLRRSTGSGPLYRLRVSPET